MGRPPGSNFGSVPPVTPAFLAPTRWRRTEQSAPTRLRMVIQQYAVLYPRSVKQTTVEYSEALASILYEKKAAQEQPRDELRNMIHKQLFDVLERKRPSADDD